MLGVRTMRHIQRIIPVRLQYGTRGSLAERPNGRLAHTADTIGGPDTRLTRLALDALREMGRLSEYKASVLRMLDTRKGRKTLRALMYRYRQRMPITWPV